MEKEENIYSAPESELIIENEELTNVEPATRGLRFANFLIDYFAYLFISLLLGITIGLVFGEKGIEAVEKIPDVLLGLPLYYSIS